MRGLGSAFVLLLILLSTGCLANRPSRPSHYWHIAFRNLWEAPCRGLKNQFFKHQSYHDAHRAWLCVKSTHPETTFSWDYENGFIEGFVDYLEAGGNGEPPAIPPFRYRNAHHENLALLQATREWFDGFRHGSAVAKASGLRELHVVPVSDLPRVLTPQQPYAANPQPTTPSPVRPPATPGVRKSTAKKDPSQEKRNKASEVLPPPKKLPGPKEKLLKELPKKTPEPTPTPKKKTRAKSALLRGSKESKRVAVVSQQIGALRLHISPCPPSLGGSTYCLWPPLTAKVVHQLPPYPPNASGPKLFGALAAKR